ncbi:hypothetical protein AHV57_28020 [Salmonella enterica]|nr:hypothetical protein [Salmonella enterica]
MEDGQVYADGGVYAQVQTVRAEPVRLHRIFCRLVMFQFSFIKQCSLSRVTFTAGREAFMPGQQQLLHHILVQRLPVTHLFLPKNFPLPQYLLEFITGFRQDIGKYFHSRYYITKNS